MNLFRTWYETKNIKEAPQVKQLVMDACHWNNFKWLNKLGGKSGLTDLEKEMIVKVEKKLRVCAELDWSHEQYDLLTDGTGNLTAAEKSVLEKYKGFTLNNVFEHSEAVHRAGVDVVHK